MPLMCSSLMSFLLFLLRCSLALLFTRTLSVRWRAGGSEAIVVRVPTFGGVFGLFVYHCSLLFVLQTLQTEKEGVV